MLVLLIPFQDVVAFDIMRSNSHHGPPISRTGHHRRLSQQPAKLPTNTIEPVKRDDIDLENVAESNRRQSLVALATLVSDAMVVPPQPSHAFGLFPEAPRRQLELCIVSLLRLSYWAETAAAALQSDNPDVRKSRYLEARLASKALVTGKVGGGANLNVFNLNSLQCKGCLTDLVGYAGDTGNKGDKRKMEDLQTDLLESLASIVEFDGLETTIDPSPRSSLTMAMYTDAKAVFVRRTLTERVIPTTNAIIRLFPDVMSACEAYVQKTYSDELPPRLQPPPTASSGQ